MAKRDNAEAPESVGARFVVRQVTAEHLLLVRSDDGDAWIQVDATPLGLSDQTEVVVRGSYLGRKVFRFWLPQRGGIWSSILEIDSGFHSLERLDFVQEQMIDPKGTALEFIGRTWIKDAQAFLDAGGGSLSPAEKDRLSKAFESIGGAHNPNESIPVDLRGQLFADTCGTSDWWGWTFTGDFVLAMTALGKALQDQGR